MRTSYPESGGLVEGRGYRQKDPGEWNHEDCLKWALDTQKVLGLTESGCLNLANFGTVTGQELRRYEEGDFERLVHMYASHFFKAFRKLIKKSQASSSHNPSTSTSDMFTDLSANFMHSSRNWSAPQQRSELEVSSNSDYNLPYTDGNSCLSRIQPSSFTLDLDESLGQKEPTSTYFTQPEMLSGATLSYGSSKNRLQSYNTSFSSDQSYKSPEMDVNYTLPNYFDSLEIQSTDFELRNLTEIESDLEQQDFHDLDQMVHGQQREWTLDDYERTNYSTNSETSTMTGCSAASLPLPRDEQQKKGRRKRKSIQRIMDVGTSDLSCAVGPIPETDSTIREFLLKKIPNKSRSDRERHPHVSQYLVRFFLHPDLKDKYVRWEDEDQGHFRLLKPQEIAAIWGSRSRVRDHLNPLDYNNFAKTIRSNYSSGKLLPVEEKKFVFKFSDEIMEQFRNESPESF